MTVDTTTVDPSDYATEIVVQTHHHAWHAWAGDDRWRCTKPGCDAWISRLVDSDGKEIPLPKETDL